MKILIQGGRILHPADGTEQPADVAVNEITIRPTRQEF